ncbi:THEGL protein, partial [Polypterus senegalus]
MPGFKEIGLAGLGIAVTGGVVYAVWNYWSSRQRESSQRDEDKPDERPRVASEVSSAACNSTANPRTQELAKHKIVSKRYLPARDSAWPVSPGARSAAASPRTQELCKPISR